MLPMPTRQRDRRNSWLGKTGEVVVMGDTSILGRRRRTQDDGSGIITALEAAHLIVQLGLHRAASTRCVLDQ